MKILVSVDFLDSLLAFQSKVLTGKILKRIEVLDKDSLRKELRELLPEWCRELKYNLQSYSQGVESFEFEFKRPTEDTTH
jgi:hypothetical protein